MWVAKPPLLLFMPLPQRSTLLIYRGSLDTYARARDHHPLPHCQKYQSVQIHCSANERTMNLVSVKEFVLPFFFSPACEQCLKSSGKLLRRSTEQHIGTYRPTSVSLQARTLRNCPSALKRVLRLKNQKHHCRHFSTLQRIHRPLTTQRSNKFKILGSFTKQMSTSRILAAAGRFLRIRYIVLGSAVGGGVTLNKVSKFQVFLM